MKERWRPVVGWSFYEVSNFGRVKSLQREVRCKGGTRLVVERILKLSLNKDGYPVVSLYNGNKENKTYPVHLLVLRAFRGPCPPGKETRHLDGNPGNARLKNLKYGTPVKNWEDRKRHGRGVAGKQNPNWKGGISL